LKPIPQEIQAAGSELSVRWSDGHQSRYDARELRLACRCAACVDEWSHKKIVSASQVPLQVTPKAIEMVGHYALHFSWSDGHSTGIYSYDFLREICACKQCGGERSFDV
jgi:DUF971 family protein